MRLGDQHFNLADLAYCQRTTFDLLHTSPRVFDVCCTRRQHRGHRDYYPSCAKKQQRQSISSKDCRGYCAAVKGDNYVESCKYRWTSHTSDAHPVSDCSMG